VETQVLQEDDLSVAGLADDLLNLFSDAVRCELDLLSTKKLRQFWHNGLQGVFVVDLSVGSSEVGHEDDGLGTIVNSIFDRWDGSGDTLVVGDVLVGIKRDVEIDLLLLESLLGLLVDAWDDRDAYSDQHPLALEIAVSD
jgi:hypothetical protein